MRLRPRRAGPPPPRRGGARRGGEVGGGRRRGRVPRMARRGAAYFPPQPEWGSDDPARVRRDFRWGLLWGHGPPRVRYSVAYEPEEMKLALSGMVGVAGGRRLLCPHPGGPILESGREL